MRIKQAQRIPGAAANIEAPIHAMIREGRLPPAGAKLETSAYLPKVQKYLGSKGSQAYAWISDNPDKAKALALALGVGGAAIGGMALHNRAKRKREEGMEVTANTKLAHDAYWHGFAQKCAEYGVDPRALLQ